MSDRNEEVRREEDKSEESSRSPSTARNEKETADQPRNRDDREADAPLGDNEHSAEQ